VIIAEKTAETLKKALEESGKGAVRFDLVGFG